MAQALAKYSIETDNMILLIFTDGSSQRLPYSGIENILTGGDLRRVKRAIMLRRRFLSRHMPRLFAISLAIAIAVFGIADGKKMMSMMSPHRHPTGQTTPAPVVPASAIPVPVTPQPEANLPASSSVIGGSPVPATTAPKPFEQAQTPIQQVLKPVDELIHDLPGLP